MMEFLLEQAKQQAKAEFVIPYDRQALADYLGVERSAMSAEISKLKKAGRIDCSGSRFRVLTPDKESSQQYRLTFSSTELCVKSKNSQNRYIGICTLHQSAPKGASL